MENAFCSSHFFHFFRFAAAATRIFSPILRFDPSCVSRMSPNFSRVAAATIRAKRDLRQKSTSRKFWSSCGSRNSKKNEENIPREFGRDHVARGSSGQSPFAAARPWHRRGGIRVARRRTPIMLRNLVRVGVVPRMCDMTKSYM